MKKILFTLLLAMFSITGFSQHYKTSRVAMFFIATDSVEMISRTMDVYIHGDSITIWGNKIFSYTTVGIPTERKYKDRIALSYIGIDEEDIPCTIIFSKWVVDKLFTISINYSNMIIIYFLNKVAK